MDKKINFWVAIVVALVGGWFGLQHFYTEQTFWGILDILFWWTGIPALVAYIQAIVWLFRGQEDFNKRFNK